MRGTVRVRSPSWRAGTTLPVQPSTLREYRSACQCRKPAPGMLHQAAHDLGIDLTRSWMIGDSPSDVAAGRRAGTRTVLVRRQALNCPLPDRQSSTTYDLR
ncbi:HAD hydrolase-like protein [Kitasatospora sp. NPDC097691]|uniref:HAD hydrolase-like protein n=1 Tax=Kitasatospora sp. NPDC097691 TaxID=3157231 RepID=UPI00331FB580